LIDAKKKAEQTGREKCGKDENLSFGRIHKLEITKMKKID